MTQNADSATVCAACPVQRGECRLCGTFWVAQGAKLYGVRPTDGNAWASIGEDTRHPRSLNHWPNVLSRNGGFVP